MFILSKLFQRTYNLINTLLIIYYVVTTTDLLWEKNICALVCLSATHFVVYIETTSQHRAINFSKKDSINFNFLPKNKSTQLNLLYKIQQILSLPTIGIYIGKLLGAPIGSRSPQRLANCWPNNVIVKLIIGLLKDLLVYQTMGKRSIINNSQLSVILKIEMLYAASCGPLSVWRRQMDTY